MHGTRLYLLAGALTVALTAGSVAAVATTHGTTASAMHRSPGPATSCRVPALPGQLVRVVLMDMGGMGMMGSGRMALRVSTGELSSGTVSIAAVNRGTRTHEVVVLPLAPGSSAGQRVVAADNTVDETGSIGEASRSCGSGHGDGIRAGAAGWVTLSLPRGRYELICNLPGHYAAGMYAELDAS